MTKGVRHVTANSKAGRQFYNIGKPVPVTAFTAEQQQWNQDLEKKQAAKLAARNATARTV